MRNGKIAKMPEWVREKLNERLEKGELSKTILAWMNEEPNPGQKPIAGFDGVPISKQNLSQWRRGGFREWQIRKEIGAADAGMKDLGRTVEMAPLAENLLLKVMGHYAVLVNPWDGKPDEKFEAEVRVLRGMLRDATLMQRAAGQADKLKEEIRRRKREREDLWGGGGLVEAMRETLRKQREERVEAELQRRADAQKEKDSAEGVVKEEVVSESGSVAPGQSESHVEAGVNAEAQRTSASSVEAREDAKGEKDLVEEEKAEAADCSSGTLSQATGTAALPGTPAVESELVTPGQSESHVEEGGNAETSASSVEAREDAKGERDSAGGAEAGRSELVTVGHSESHLESGGNAETSASSAEARGDAKGECLTTKNAENTKTRAALG